MCCGRSGVPRTARTTKRVFSPQISQPGAVATEAERGLQSAARGEFECSLKRFSAFATAERSCGINSALRKYSRTTTETFAVRTNACFLPEKGRGQVA